jgi:hypothetical protein
MSEGKDESATARQILQPKQGPLADSLFFLLPDPIDSLAVALELPIVTVISM